MKAAALSLVVLTLNVSGPRRVHQGWPTRREALAARLRAERPDAAAFQELWRGEDLEALAEAAGLPHRAHAPALGLAVASRRPVESFESLDLGGGWGALRARLGGGAGLDVYAARLTPGEGPAAARRLAQLFRLAEFVRAGSAGRPMVLLGDLGAGADDREAALLLDMLEARDLCVAHGDEVCGRTLGEARRDFALIPYSARPPRENARAAFTGLAGEDGEAARFGLIARLEAPWPRLAAASGAPSRPDALAAVESALSEAREEAGRSGDGAGWIPFAGAWRLARAQDEAAALAAAVEEVRSARARPE